MQILAFAATSSRRSINKRLIGYAAHLLEHELDTSAAPGGSVDVEIIDLNDFEMPLYSIDRQDELGIPAEAKDFHDRIGAADGLLVSFAEHNGLYTAAYKNLFDWTSRIDMRVYQEKPTAMLATSLGGRGGRNVLETAVKLAPFFGADVRGQLSVPSFNDNFDTDAGRLTDPDLDAALREVLLALVADRDPEQADPAGSTTGDTTGA